MKFFYITILAAVVVAIYCLNVRYEIFAVNIPKGEEKGDEYLRVMTYNVNTFTNMKDVDGFRKGLIEEIDRHNPDILCLQDLMPVVFKQIQT